jgi:hypothetical protein
MKSGSLKSLGKKSRQRRFAEQQSSVGQNLEQQYQELLRLREKVRSLTKTAAGSRQRPKRKNRD